MCSLKHRHPSIPDWITCLSLHPKVALVNQDISHALEKIIFKDTIQARNSRSDHHRHEMSLEQSTASFIFACHSLRHCMPFQVFVWREERGIRFLSIEWNPQKGEEQLRGSSSWGFSVPLARMPCFSFLISTGSIKITLKPQNFLLRSKGKCELKVSITTDLLLLSPK